MAGNRIESGLANLGNTCFMNASLQLLLHVEPLVSFFISGSFQNDLNSTSRTEGKIAVSFADLVRQISCNEIGTAISPVHFQKVVGAFAPYLMDYQQQDCQEFLRFILDGLGEDLKRVHKTTGKVTGSTEAIFNTTVIANAPADISDVNPNVSINGSGTGLVEDTTVLAPSGSLPSLFDAAPTTNNALNSSGGIVNKLRNLTLQAGQSLSLSLRSTGSDREKQGDEEAADINTDDRERKEEDIDKVLLSAAKSWQQYVDKNDSIITDLFAGLLQSTVECCQCHNRSYTFDPFLDLSVPIPNNASHRASSSNVKSSLNNTFKYSNWRSGGSNPGMGSEKSADNCTLEECLQQFTREEVLDGDNMVTCDKCNQKQKSIKKIMILRYPKILVIHINRFRYTSFNREKLSTDVKFPLKSLDLTSFLQHPEQGTNEVFNDLGNTRGSSMSKSSPLSPKVLQNHIPTTASACATKDRMSNVSLEDNYHDAPLYDLAGISNHSGSIHGGHYVAHVDMNNGHRRRFPGTGPKQANVAEQKMPNILPSASPSSNVYIALSPPSDSGGYGDVVIHDHERQRELSDKREEMVVASTSPRWMCFNDTRVSSVSTTSIGGPSAYVLFYNLVPLSTSPISQDGEAVPATTSPVADEHPVSVGSRSAKKKKRKDPTMSQSPGLFSTTTPLPSAGRVMQSASSLESLHNSLPQLQFPTIGPSNSSSNNRTLPKARPASNLLAV